MWILESNGDFLQGKRMWLKPGQKYLFGRVKREGVRFAIDHKTVSRKHFVIEVDAVDSGDVGQIHVRTKIRIEDQNSKTGTSVNGEVIKNTSRELKDTENSIRPGTCPHEIVIRWQPCVLTFNLLKKEVKSGVLKTKQTRVQGLDVKAVSDFSSEHTTHVVANKRNTAKGLLALVAAKHLVAESYIDALEYKATPTNLSQDENLSFLEIDFDSAWPDPEDHLPPPGKEPTIRSADCYQPDPSRATIFEGYTFVFGDQIQYDNLLPVVTTGHGKGILFKVANGETTTEELVQFLQNASGRKGGDDQTSANGNAILVRWQGKDDFLEWTNALINETALKLDQRAIDQSEFLDAILANDVELMRQSIPFESTTDGKIAPPPSVVSSLVTKQSSGEGARAVSASRSQGPEEHAPAQGPSQNVAQANTNGQAAPRPFQGPRFTQASRFKDFDDGFDPDEIAAYDDDDDDDIEEASIAGSETGLRSRTQSLGIKDEPLMASRKRARSPSEEPADAFAEDLDSLLPAATAFKRQRLAKTRANGQAIQNEAGGRQPAKKAKKDPELNVRELVKAQREEKEEAARREEEELEAIPGNLENQGPANLVTVVTMELPLRDHGKQTNPVNGEHGEEWDPRWNGRKNFKRFRRKGEAPQRRGHAGKVIVPLVEVKENTYGLGEQYWDKTEEEKEREREKRKREEARSQRTQSQTQRSSGTVGKRSRVRVVSEDEDEDENAVDAHDGGDAVSVTSGIDRLQREAAEIVEHEIDLDTPRRTRAADRSQTANSSATQTTNTAKSSSTARGKRAATTNTNTREAKRQKTLPVTVVHASDSEDEDSDDMKFRFGSRARRRGKG